MSCDPIVSGGEVVGTICRPSSEWLFRPDTPCPFCEYTVGLVGMAQEWYDTEWTCLACGEHWTHEGYYRPFERGWRRQNVERALPHVEGARVISEAVAS